MSVVELRSGTDRYVLFLKNPKNVYIQQVDGSVKDRVDTQVNEFLTETTPESALESEDKFPNPLRQLKDRGGKVRGLGVWCQGDNYDLFIVQALFDKDDEDKIYSRMFTFRDRAKDLEKKFSDLTHVEMSKKADEWRERDDVLLFTPPGCP